MTTSQPVRNPKMNTYRNMIALFTFATLFGCSGFEDLPEYAGPVSGSALEEDATSEPDVTDSPEGDAGRIVPPDTEVTNNGNEDAGRIEDEPAPEPPQPDVVCSGNAQGQILDVRDLEGCNIVEGSVLLHYLAFPREEINFPDLKVITGQLSIAYGSNLREIHIPNLKSVEIVHVIFNEKLEYLDLRSLTTVSGHMFGSELHKVWIYGNILLPQCMAEAVMDQNKPTLTPEEDANLTPKQKAVREERFYGVIRGGDGEHDQLLAPPFRILNPIRSLDEEGEPSYPLRWELDADGDPITAAANLDCPGECHFETNPANVWADCPQ